VGAVGRQIVSGLLLLGAVRALGAQELVTARFDVRSAAAVDSVRRLGIDVVETRPRPDGSVQIVAVVSARDRFVLAARGWLAEAVPRPPLLAAQEARRAALGPRAFTVFRDFDDPARGIAAWLRAFDASHANVTVDSIGASVEGRPILAAKIGAPGDDPGRPNVLFVATYHAREWAATDFALRLVQYLADSLPNSPGGAALLASRDVWVLPVVNPDGYEYTFTTERLWRKNRRANPDGTFGVDLNRNHTGFFALDDAGSSPTPSSEVYRGPSPASEPETRAVEAFHAAHPPAVSISYHTYAGAILYPWGHVTGALAGDDGVMRAVAGSDLASAILDSVPGSENDHYHPGPGWQLYPTNGDYTDWAYRQHGTLGFTVELTSGCCVGGASYGFEFPDDDTLLARVARDNIPFALALLAAAGNPARATGPADLAAAQPEFEAVWPEVRVLVPATAPSPAGAFALEVATDSGVIRGVTLTGDSLGRGLFFTRLTAPRSRVTDSRALRVAQAGLIADILARDGAERTDSPWNGFRRTSTAFEGTQAWAGVTDTLVSPEIPIAGRRGLRLYFWTQHGGSVFNHQLQGRVEVSTDGGASWTLVYRAIGAGNAWYPVAVPLDLTPGASGLRVRFIADNMSWLVDAIAIAAGETRLFDAVPAVGGQVEVSANPVRSGPVTLHWPPGPGTARIEIFSTLGTRVAGESLPQDLGRWVWTLETAGGAPVASGMYVVVVTRSDGARFRRRLFVTR
jgi:hypothetical protein